jgi:hypothetical protein
MSIPVTLLLLGSFLGQEKPCPRCGAKAPEEQARGLIVGDDSGKTVTFSAAELSRLKQSTIKVDLEGEKAVYEGVLVGDLLRAIGVPLDLKCGTRDDAKLRVLIGTGVVVDAADGYRALFSLMEVDPDRKDNPVLLASKKDGQPLGKEGPYQVIEPEGKIKGRWVQQVVRIQIRYPAGPIPRIKPTIDEQRKP